MGWASSALTIGGTLLSARGAEAEADATAWAAKYNANVAIANAQQSANAIRAQGQVVRGRNIARVAKSGVRMEGSPLSVMAENAYSVERAAQNAMRVGEAQKRLYLMEADAARAAGKYRQASAWISGASTLLRVNSGVGVFGAGKSSNDLNWTGDGVDVSGIA